MQKTAILRLLKNLILITFLVLFYVHQQVEIVKASYAIDKNQKELSYLLDQHQALVYNLNKSAKPSELEKGLAAGRIDLEIPDKEDILYVSTLQEGKPEKSNARARRNIFIKVLDFFSARAEAQVK